MKLEEAIKNVEFLIRDLKVDNYNSTFIQAIETVLEALENSIPKKKIEDKIKKYLEYDKKVKTYTSDGRENFTAEYYKAKTLQELLEEEA